jgi:hypothetical protein
VPALCLRIEQGEQHGRIDVVAARQRHVADGAQSFGAADEEIVNRLGQPRLLACSRSPPSGRIAFRDMRSLRGHAGHPCLRALVLRG